MMGVIISECSFIGEIRNYLEEVVGRGGTVLFVGFPEKVKRQKNGIQRRQQTYFPLCSLKRINNAFIKRLHSQNNLQILR